MMQDIFVRFVCSFFTGTSLFGIVYAAWSMHIALFGDGKNLTATEGTYSKSFYRYAVNCRISRHLS